MLEHMPRELRAPRRLSPEQQMRSRRNGEHAADHIDKASRDAVMRFHEDGKRFPPMADEEGFLLWKRDQWRTPAPQRRYPRLGQTGQTRVAGALAARLLQGHHHVG